MKNRKTHIILPTALIGLEAIKLYTIFSFVLLIPEKKPLSILYYAAAIFISYTTHKLLSLIRLRPVIILLVNLIMFSLAFALILTGYPDLPFFGITTLSAFTEAAAHINSGKDWFCLSLLIFSVVITWFRGITVSRKPITHQTTLNRFEGGILIIGSIFFLRFGMGFEYVHAVPLVTGYFLFGMIALAVAVSQSRSGTFTGKPGQTRVYLAVFGITVFILTFSIMFLFFPIAGSSTEKVFTLFSKSVSPLKPYLIAIIRFVFTIGFPVRASAPSSTVSSTVESTIPVESPLWFLIIERLITWGIIFLVSVTTILITGYLLYKLTLFLFSPSKSNKDSLSFKAFTKILLNRLRYLCHTFTDFIFKRTVRREPRKKAQLPQSLVSFSVLCSWGTKAGVPRLPSETPAEYAARLRNLTEKLNPVIATITEKVQTEVYGGILMSNDESLVLKKAARKLVVFTTFFTIMKIRIKLYIGSIRNVH